MIRAEIITPPPDVHRPGERAGAGCGRPGGGWQAQALKSAARNVLDVAEMEADGILSVVRGHTEQEREELRQLLDRAGRWLLEAAAGLSAMNNRSAAKTRKTS
jgi:hypothetical protein